MRMGPEWFQGTADAVFQNINLIRDHNPGLVIVFGADHIYRMDIRRMIDFHLSKGADVTVAARSVPLDEASAFGVIVADSELRITGFQEKPRRPAPMPGRPDRAFVSMGNYIFNKDVLVDALGRSQRLKQHDFGAHVIPALVEAGKVFAYDFSSYTIPGAMPYEETGYWRDVGTIASYFSAHMDMIGKKPLFELNNRQWPIHGGGFAGAPARILRGEVRNCMIADGAVIDGAKVKNSVIGSGVVIDKGASVEDCIIMENTVIKKDCRLRRVIVDKLNIIEEGEEIGFNPDVDRFRCHIDTSGIGILPRGGRGKRSQ
jgi:glucose-1-phosphate adenylyltransferase